MGILLNANCRKCGFQQPVPLGAGRLTYETECAFPALNKETGELISVNYLQKDLLPAHIHLYDQEDMHDGVTNRKTHNWQKASLNETNNLCPQCGAFQMDFFMELLFD